MPLLLIAFVPAILMIALAVALIGGTIWFLIGRPYLTLENFCRAFMSDAKKKKEEVKKVEEVKTVKTLDIIVMEKRA